MDWSVVADPLGGESVVAFQQEQIGEAFITECGEFLKDAPCFQLIGLDITYEHRGAIEPLETIECVLEHISAAVHELVELQRDDEGLIGEWPNAVIVAANDDAEGATG